MRGTERGTMRAQLGSPPCSPLQFPGRLVGGSRRPGGAEGCGEPQGLLIGSLTLSDQLCGRIGVVFTGRVQGDRAEL